MDQLSQFTFARPLILWALLLVPALLVLVWRAEVLSRRAVKLLIAERLLPRLATQVAWGQRRVIGVLRALGLAAIIIALAGPRMGFREVERESRGLDIIFLVDVSRSMLAQDISPDRLTRTKLAALDLAESLRGDRLGLVAFAGGGFLQVPLTIDYTAMRESLQELDTDIIPTQGTNIADAIRLAMDAFGKEPTQSRALVIFSDGEEWSTGVEDELKTLTERGIPVFTVGVGTTEGAMIPTQDHYGRQTFHRDANGKVVQTRLQEDVLKQIATRTGGRYERLDQTPRLAEAIQANLQRVTSDGASITSREPLERFQWPLLAGIAFLALGNFMKDHRSRASSDAKFKDADPTTAAPAKPRRKSHGLRNRMLRGIRKSVDPRPSQTPLLTAAAWLSMALAAAWSGTPSAQAKTLGEQAFELQQANENEKALELYRKQLEQKPDSPARDVLNFNSGVAAYRADKVDDAIKEFSQSLLSEDARVQELSHYNLGKSFFKKGESLKKPAETLQSWESAIEQYKNALKLNPENSDAKANLDYAQMRIEQLKQQQPPEDQEQQQQDQKQDQKDKGGEDQKDKQQGGEGDKNQDQEQKQDGQQGDQQDQEKGQDQQAQNDQQKPGEEKGSQGQQPDQPKGSDQATNEEGKEGGDEQKEGGEPGDKPQDQQASNSSQGKINDQQKPESSQKPGEEQNPAVDDTAQQDPQEQGEGQASQDFQADPNKPGEQESNANGGTAAAAAAAEPRALTEQQAAALLESLEGEEAKGTVLESRSARRTYGKDW